MTKVIEERVQFMLDVNLKTKLKVYCNINNITMTELFRNYVIETLNEEEKKLGVDLSNTIDIIPKLV